jgi:hypothetical protein
MANYVYVCYGYWLCLYLLFFYWYFGAVPTLRYFYFIFTYISCVAQKTNLKKPEEESDKNTSMSEQLQNTNRKIVNRGTINNHSTHIRDHSFSQCRNLCAWNLLLTCLSVNCITDSRIKGQTGQSYFILVQKNLLKW